MQHIDHSDKALFAVLVFAALMVMGYGTYAMQDTSALNANLIRAVDGSYRQAKEASWHYQSLSSGQKPEDIANDWTVSKIATRYP